MSGSHVGLYITFWAQAGKIDALQDAVVAMIPTAEGEEGTLSYGMHRVADGERHGVSVYEIYSDAEAQALHGQSAALAELKGKFADLLGAPPEAYYLAPIPGAAKGLPF